MPVTVATDFATVVEAGDGLTIPVTCAGTSVPAPSPRPMLRMVPSRVTRQHLPRSTRTRRGLRGSLACTGADAEGLVGALFVGAIMLPGWSPVAASIVTKARTSSP